MILRSFQPFVSISGARITILFSEIQKVHFFLHLYFYAYSLTDWLSGLTCTDENFCQKAGSVAFTKADEKGIAMIMPDTSPRGEAVVNNEAYDLGQGACVLGLFSCSTEDETTTHSLTPCLYFVVFFTYISQHHF
jgi:hypothetical protein